jgi:hypothetical protein
MPPIKVLTALLLFRLFYLLIPLGFAIIVVIFFERRKLKENLHRSAGMDTIKPNEATTTQPETGGS